MKYYIYFHYYHKYAGDYHFVIILPHKIVSDKFECCQLDNEDEIIIRYIGNWRGDNIQLSYKKYLDLHKGSWWDQFVIFSDAFVCMDNDSTYRMDLLHCDNIIHTYEGKYEQIIIDYIDYIWKGYHKNIHFMQKYKINITKCSIKS